MSKSRPKPIHLVDGPLRKGVHEFLPGEVVPDQLRIAQRSNLDVVHIYRVSNGRGYYVRSEFNVGPERRKRLSGGRPKQ